VATGSEPAPLLGAVRGRKFILCLRPDSHTPQPRERGRHAGRARRQAAPGNRSEGLCRSSDTPPVHTSFPLFSEASFSRARRKLCRTRLNSSTGTSGTTGLESVGSRRTSSVVPTPRERSPGPIRTCKRARSATCRVQVKRPRTADREESGPDVERMRAL